MLDAAPFLGTFACAYVGFALLALAMKRHWREALGADRAGDAPSKNVTILLRILAAGALGGGLLITLLSDGPSFGSALWVVVLSLGAMAVVATLAWRPTALRPLAQPFRTRRERVDP